MKKRGELKKFSFIQDWGTYQVDTIVVVGLNHDEILEFYKKEDACPEQIKAFADCREQLADCYKQKGFYWKPESLKAGVLWMRNWADCWENYETLLHELHHAVHFYLVGARQMQDEMEAQAYQQEYLFRAIRRRLAKELEKVENRQKKRAKLSPKR
jgi:hypothetical protein